MSTTVIINIYLFFTVDAKKVMSSFFGAGNDKMMIEIYNYINMGKETYLTVTKGSCIPLMTYQKGQNSVLDINYFGITLGIMNMTVFDVPKACMRAVQVSPIRLRINYEVFTRMSTTIA